MELGRKERIINEQQIVISDLKAKRAESDRQRLILLEKSSANTTIPSPFHQSGEKREDELELIQLRQIKEILEKELNALKKSLKSQKDHNAEQLVEIKKLHEEIALLNKQKELFQMDLLQQQSTRTEYQLSELRKDISETTLNWEITEQNNQRFQEIAAKYQELIQREQEKVVLLETQNQLLEERMEMMKQELNIFRSLDIYEATITSEMKKYHSRRSPLVSKKPITQAEKKENYQSEEPLLSSDDEYDGAYHSAKASHPSPAPVPLTTHSSRSSTTATRLSGSRVDSHTTPLNWGSEPKGDGDDRNLPGDEDVGPELVLRDISQSPQLPLRAQTSLKSSFDSVKSNLQSHNLQDSKQITPSLTRNLERRDVFSPSQVKERSDSTWKPSPSPALLSRHLGSQNEVKSRTVGSAKPEVPSRIPNQQERNTSTDTPTSATRTHQTLRAGGLTQSSRPSKEEFERAKKLLAKR